MCESHSCPCTDAETQHKPSTTTLWMQLSNQFIIHQPVHPSNPSLSNSERRMLGGTMPKALQNSRKTTFIACLLSTDVVTPSQKATTPSNHCRLGSFICARIIVTAPAAKRDKLFCLLPIVFSTYPTCLSSTETLHCAYLIQ